jgi:Cathepsin propeptide inhibitor domain (I29)
LGTVSTNLANEWESFKRQYKKEYATVIEEAERRQIFTENVNRMRAYQQAHPDATFKMAINHLTDRRIQVIHRFKYH